MVEAAHARAFTVAKAARLDILSTIRGEVDRALADGITEREFVRTLEPRLRKLGWWGRQVVVSPEGEAEMVRLGSPRRLKTIFRVNTRASSRHTLTPDPGWSYNPGRQPFGPPPGGDPTQLPNIVAGQKPWSAYGGLARVLPRDPPRAPIPAAATPAEARSRIREVLDDAGPGYRRAKTPGGLDDVILTDDFIEHVAGRTGERERFADFILPTIHEPAEVWLQAQQTASGPAYRRVFVGAYEGAGDMVIVAQEDPKKGLLAWTFYPTSEINERRAGYLLYRRPE